MTVSVSEAMNSRASIRDFLPTPVPEDVLRRVLSTASRAPSGGNLQPWHIDIVSGEKLDQLKALMQQTLADVASGAHSEAREYDIYPKELAAPYRDYRFKVGEDMYARLGIPREDKAARLQWFARNYQFFGAPTALFCTVDRGMGPPQWSDLGMFLQSVMLLLREEGLDSCAQECWAVYPTTIRGFLGTPDNRMLFTGMSIGYRNPDHPVNALRTGRAALDGFVQFHG
ncbi:nitroreductase family protein [Comamonas serinivorans]|uniref:Nitroreductase family protein n=1 Tax=Comamonas serinivorans TaxID=1082851 RepID=A0A1Y0EML4_9BURK|nr:nitroreductase [Comamonas serinivorans]ARU04827.1 nitroreductase family protein [Comamonas serinivorans]